MIARRSPPNDTTDLLRDGAAIDRAVAVAHREVIERHRRLDLPLAIWRDDRVVLVSPHDIPLPDPPPMSDASDAPR